MSCIVWYVPSKQSTYVSAADANLLLSRQGLIRQWSYWDYYQRQMDELPEVYLSSIEDTHDLVGKWCREFLPFLPNLIPWSLKS